MGREPTLPPKPHMIRGRGWQWSFWQHYSKKHIPTRLSIMGRSPSWCHCGAAAEASSLESVAWFNDGGGEETTSSGGSGGSHEEKPSSSGGSGGGQEEEPSLGDASPRATSHALTLTESGKSSVDIFSTRSQWRKTVSAVQEPEGVVEK